jgi:tRNA(fMet)-specific endonuclease VapC
LSYLLDTNVCIGLVKGDDALVRRCRAEHPRDLALCSPVKAELLYGARKSVRVEHNLAGLDRFFVAFRSYPFDDRAAEEYGLIRADLERAGLPIGGNDLLIAAIARARDCTLVTANTREFFRVPGLRVIDWRTEQQSA